MTTLTEGDLQVSFGDASSGRKVDGIDHGLTCMKAVDFIVEFDDRYLFIEFKDPQDPGAPKERGTKFIEDFKSSGLDSVLKYKYRDSVLYEWASGRADKPIYYFVLIAWDDLTSGDLETRTEALKRQLPLKGPISGSWTRTIVTDCAVFNVDSWNRIFPKYPVIRLSTNRSRAIQEERTI